MGFGFNCDYGDACIDNRGFHDDCNHKRSIDYDRGLVVIVAVIAESMVSKVGPVVILFG